MAVGLAVYDVPATQLLDLCRAAETAGVDRVWVGEHVVAPVTSRSEHPTASAGALPPRPVVDVETHLVDPFTALGAAAGATSRLGLATGIYLIGLRHPLASARAATTLQQVAGGRFAFGVGAGWLREEFEALGVSFAGRHRRLAESLEILRLGCSGRPFCFDGEFYRFDTVQVTQHPVDVPIIMGGNSDGAIRRAVALADGWVSSGIPSLDEAVSLERRVRLECSRQERHAPLETFFRVPGCEPDLRRRYLDRGISNIVVVIAEVQAQLGLDVISGPSIGHVSDVLGSVVDGG